MKVAFQRMFWIFERWNINQVTPSLSKPHELSYRSNKLNTKSREMENQNSVMKETGRGGFPLKENKTTTTPSTSISDFFVFSYLIK